MLFKVNKEVVAEILEQMPESKKVTLGKALYRNYLLTSAKVLENCTLIVYKEGWLVKLEGTRCNFSVFAKDNDGEYEVVRKPVEKKLHKLYEDWGKMNEGDFDRFPMV